MSIKTILVAEDDLDIRRNMQQLLALEGYHVEIAENGKIALNLLQQATDLPALIVLDLMMPVMDGFEFRERQRKIPRLANIPFMVMTADVQIDPDQLQIGARATLHKPVDIDVILNLVEKFAA